MVKTVNRTAKVTMNLLKDLDNYGKRTNSGRPSCLTARDAIIIRIASNSSSTARQIAKKAEVTTNIKNV